MKSKLSKILVSLVTYAFIVNTSIAQNETSEMVADAFYELFKENNYKDALILCKERLAINNNDVLLHFFMAEAYHNLGNESESDKAMDYVYNFKPQTVRDYEDMTHISMIYNDYKKAYSLIKEALKISDSTVQDQQASLLVKQAAIRKEINVPGESSKVKFENITELYEKALQAKNSKVQGKTVYALKASYERLIGELDTAINTFSDGIKTYPDFTLGYMNLAFLYSEKEDYKEALRISDIIITLVNNGTNSVLDAELSPDVGSNLEDIDNLFPVIYNNRGYVKYKLNDLEGALTDVNYSILMLPENAYAHRNKALINIALGNKDAACNDLQKALDLGFTKDYGLEVQALKDKNCEKR